MTEGQRQSRVLVVVPCGIAKIWRKNSSTGPTIAKDAYVGPPFTVNRKYAERFSPNDWVILSAKYGFIAPDFMIEGDYNVSFNDPGTHPISIEELASQVRARGLDHYDSVVALGSSAYAETVKEAFGGTHVAVHCPTAGLPLPKVTKLVSEATTNGIAFQADKKISTKPAPGA